MPFSSTTSSATPRPHFCPFFFSSWQYVGSMRMDKSMRTMRFDTRTEVTRCVLLCSLHILSFLTRGFIFGFRVFSIIPPVSQPFLLLLACCHVHFLSVFFTHRHTHTHIHTPSSSSLFVDLPFALFFVSFFFLWLLKGGHQACVRGCWSAPAKEAQGLADCQGDPHPYAAALRCSALLFASVKCVCVCVHTFVLK